LKLVKIARNAATMTGQALVYFLNLKLVRIILLIASICCVVFSAQVVSKSFHLGIDFSANHGFGQVLLYVIVLGGLGAFINFVWHRSIISAFLQYWRRPGRAILGFLFAAGVTLLSCTILYALLIAFGGISFSLADAAKMTPAAIMSFVGAIITGPMIASTEEVIFRGFLFNYFRSNSKAAPIAAIVGSAVIFALSHKLFKPLAWFHVGGIELFVGLSMLGITLAATYWLTRSLAMSAGVHAGVVWAEIIKTHTNVVHWHHNSWLLGDQDVRTSPLVWLMFLAILLFFHRISPWIKQRFTIEGTPNDAGRRDKKMKASNSVGNLGEAFE